MSAILTTDLCTAERYGQYLSLKLHRPHRCLTTAVVGGGWRDDLSHVVNHQFCEGAGHADACAYLSEHGHAGYHQKFCADHQLPTETTALLSTAANMSCAASATAHHRELEVSCIATAGVSSNATRAGDPTKWHETQTGSEPAEPGAGYQGTIVHLVHINQPCSAGCLSKAVAMVTEAKTCVLQDWQVASKQSNKLATGTGTDQFAIAAPQCSGDNWERQWSGSHHRLGQLLAEATYTATRRALEQQNGFSNTHRRSVLVAMERYGFSHELLEKTVKEELSEKDSTLFLKNLLAMLHDPLAVSSSFQIAHTLDLIAGGILPPETQHEALLNQAALLACGMSWKPESYPRLREKLSSITDPAQLTASALVQGFALRWTSSTTV